MKYPNPKDYYDEYGRLDLKEFDEAVSQFETVEEERSELERDQMHYTTDSQNLKVEGRR